MVTDTLQQLLDAGIIRPLDLAFAEFIVQHETRGETVLCMLAALLSNRLADQSICLHLDKLGQPFAPIYHFPDAKSISDIVSQSTMVSGSGQRKETRPIVLEDNRLYLQKYWAYEVRLAKSLQTRSELRRDVSEPALKALVDRLFDDDNSEQVDWQKVAVCVATRCKLAVITGGPGTGKTTTVTRLLAVLHGIAKQNGERLKLQLVAPTGKAAARLSESIQQAKSKLPEDLQEGLETHCSTIHRLLGSLPNRTEFKHNSRHPLHLDLLIIDEASMVDLPLMCKLFDALPAHSAVVMLGDKDQLSSVEAGSVMSDICSAVPLVDQVPVYSQDMSALLHRLCGLPIQPNHSLSSMLQDNLVTLQKSFRFSAASGIGNLAQAINQGDFNGAVDLLTQGTFSDLSWHQQAEEQELIAKLVPNYKTYLLNVKNGDLDGAFRALQHQQVLCAQRHGARGVNEINRLVEKELARQGLIEIDSEYYIGRPVMLAQNDHRLKLYNGDIGILMPDPDNPKVRKVWFLTPENRFVGVLPSRIPKHETQYAMTIHKSQGSEFDNVFMILPQHDAKAALIGLSRELVYTGLTRARKTFHLHADKQVLGRALNQQSLRSSGLQTRLQRP